MGNPATSFRDRFEELEVPVVPLHAVYGPLSGEDLIEKLHVYGRKGSPRSTITDLDPILIVNVTIGNHLTGHAGIVHGGIITLLFDEAMGWAYELIRDDPSSHSALPAVYHRNAVTANLNVCFRKPIPARTPCQLKVYCKSIKGRKVEFLSRLEKQQEEEQVLAGSAASTLYADATSLFIAISSRL